MKSSFVNGYLIINSFRLSEINNVEIVNMHRCIILFQSIRKNSNLMLFILLCSERVISLIVFFPIYVPILYERVDLCMCFKLVFCIGVSVAI